jgi:hypothetical protein
VIVTFLSKFKNCLFVQEQENKTTYLSKNDTFKTTFLSKKNCLSVRELWQTNCLSVQKKIPICPETISLCIDYQQVTPVINIINRVEIIKKYRIESNFFLFFKRRNICKLRNYPALKWSNIRIKLGQKGKFSAES